MTEGSTGRADRVDDFPVRTTDTLDRTGFIHVGPLLNGTDAVDGC